MGTPCPLGLRTKDFNSVFTIRCHEDEHINLREARAVLVYLRWLLRSRDRHKRCVVLLVDSKVVVGAITKGRYGSRTLNLLLRKISCLCFAGGLRLCIILVPTEHNPADYPSRGLHIPGSRQSFGTLRRCPGCGCLPQDHPLHVPKRKRGIGIVCKGVNGSYYFDHDRLAWMPSHTLSVLRARAIDPDAHGTKMLGNLLDDDEYCPGDIPLSKVLMHMGVSDATL